MEFQDVGASHVAQWERISLQCRRHRTCGFNPWVLEDPLKEEMATHSSILDGRVPWIEELGRLQSMDGKESKMTQHTHTICRHVLKVKAISLYKKIDK